MLKSCSPPYFSIHDGGKTSLSYPMDSTVKELHYEVLNFVHLHQLLKYQVFEDSATVQVKILNLALCHASHSSLVLHIASVNLFRM